MVIATYLDTNCIIYLLNGSSEDLLPKLENADWIGISIISHLEFLSFPGLSEHDKKLFYKFLDRINVVGLSENNLELINKILKIRKNSNVKLPDSIILATAEQMDAELLTRDKQLLNISGFNIKLY